MPLTLLVGQQEEHLAHKKRAPIIPKGSFSGTQAAEGHLKWEGKNSHLGAGHQLGLEVEDLGRGVLLPSRS